MNPLQAIKEYCIWCMNGQKGLVKECSVEDCPLYSRRMGKNQGAGTVKAIRERCLDCTSWHDGMVLNCEKEDCSLYPFRLGKNPNRKGVKRGFGKNIDN